MRQYKIIVEKHPDGYVAYPRSLCCRNESVALMSDGDNR